MVGAVKNSFDWTAALRKLAWGGAVFLIILPAVAMQFTREVDWGPGDFIVAATLLFTSAGIVDRATRVSDNVAYVLGATVAVGTGFLLIWSNLAVGIIGDEDNPANLMFFGIVLIAVIGSLLARFRARGMVRAMLVAAIAQASAAGFTLAMGWGLTEPPGAAGVIAIILFFAATWLLSAGLFWRAARGQHAAAPKAAQSRMM
jgi:hypothetical protein